MATDPRGVLRGRCTACECVQYIVQPGAVKCSQCGHPPGKHAKADASHQSQPARPAPSYAGAVSRQATGQTHSHHSSSVSAASTSSSAYGGGGYVGHRASPPPPPPDLPRCPACHKKVHYDHELGPFDYCSPECRDRHLLPLERKKLKADIAKFSSDISYLSSFGQPSEEGSGDVKGPDRNDCVEVKKKPKEDIGIIVGTNTKGGLLITGVTVKSPAFKHFKKESIKFLDVITEINGEPVTTPEAFQEGVRSKAFPRLKLKRHYNMPSPQTFIAEVEGLCPSVTHIFVLSPQCVGSEPKFGFMPFFFPQGVKIEIGSGSLKSCAHLSGIANSDFIKMYALVHNTDIGTVKQPSHSYTTGMGNRKEFEEDMKNAAREQKSLVLAVQRQTYKY